MDRKEVAMIEYREIEGWAETLKDNIFQMEDHCKECRHFSITYNDPDVGGKLRHCNAKTSLQCPEVYEVVGHLTDFLTDALQEIDFD